MKVLILGASGFIGSRLAATLRTHGISVVTASLRNPEQAAQAAAGCDAVVNLAGEPIAQRWTARVKTAVRESRTTIPAKFLEALGRIAGRPKHYISASAIGYYGNSLDQTFDEKSPAGKGFLAEICAAWEHEATRALELGMTLSIVRTGLVCGAGGGALAALLPIFRLGLGGPVGNGEQWYSWVHVDDVIGIYLHALDGVEGVLNAVAPEPVRNAEFTAALASAVHRPAIFPVPPFALRLMLGEGATVAVDGQRVLPARTIETGYAFRYPSLAPALAAIT